MSYSEELCNEILNLILNKQKIIKNYRPDYLKNPSTNRNLEYDFYLPECKIAIEIQGEHHFDDTYQKRKDLLKKQLAEKAGDKLLFFTINQIKINKIHSRIKGVLWEKNNLNPIRPFDNIWMKSDLELRCIEHIKLLKKKYGNSQCFKAVKIYEDTIEREKFLNSIVLNGFYVLRVKDVLHKIQVIEKGTRIKYISVKSKKEYFLHWKNFQAWTYRKSIIIK